MAKRSPTSAADEPLKYVELYEKEMLTKEEFDLIKSDCCQTNRQLQNRQNR